GVLGNYTITNDGADFTINRRPLTVTANSKSRQYSDPNPAFDATISGFRAGENLLTSGVTGSPACNAYTNNTYLTPVTPLNVGPGGYPSIHCTIGTLAAGNYSFPAANFADGTLTVTKEDARAFYTGDMLAFTPSGGGNANVLLRATVQDITAADPSASPPYPDNSPGVITNATATLKVDGTAPFGCSDLPVSLINSDTKTGSVNCSASLGVGPYTISITVNNYYTYTANIGVVEVAEPNGSFITGGGYIVVASSSGQYSADSGSRANYGFNVKYNKNKTNLQGHLNFIFRRNVDGVVRTYQIKTTATDSLGIVLKTSTGGVCTGPPSGACFGLGDFRSKANLTDVTDPLAPVSLGGGLTVQVTMTDKGEPGSSDSIGVTLWNGSTLLFSSQWTGAQTTEKVISGGNLVVH
ncbi:MAG: hypothetical protein OEV29_13360, partial [Thermoleophilia bacterium]|nr:hypothetical protein [Thermoleophilia bacterium]